MITGLKAATIFSLAYMALMVFLIGGLLYYVRMRQNDDLRHFLAINERLNAVIERLDSMEKKLDKRAGTETSPKPGTPPSSVK